MRFLSRDDARSHERVPANDRRRPVDSEVLAQDRCGQGLGAGTQSLQQIEARTIHQTRIADYPCYLLAWGEGCSKSMYELP